jgi:preprotein translocase subunit Sss1
MRWAAMMAFAAVYLSILGAIGYVIFHFVVKFW